MRIFGTNLFVHKRRRPAQTVREARDLLRRFLEDCPHYDFEWDDFISWKNDNPTIEKVRQDLGQVEILLISGDDADRSEAYAMLRNAIIYLDSFIYNESDR